MSRKRYWLKLVPVYMTILLLFVFISVGGNSALTVFMEQRPVEAMHTIVIDAGHGGIDGGATSCNGVLESAINLQIAVKLRDLVNLLGIRTVMVRESDISVYTTGDSIAAKKVSDLKERVRITDASDCDLLVSIHQNFFTDGRYHGAQVFYAPVTGSEVLAETIQRSFCDTINPNSSRKIKKVDGVYLLEHIRCPGVLVECGFISNPEEAKQLTEDTYQNKICCVIASSCSRYLASESTS